MLRARLYEHEIQKREEENQKQINSKTDIVGAIKSGVCFTTLSIS